MIAGQVLLGNDHDLPTTARGYGRPRTHIDDLRNLAGFWAAPSSWTRARTARLAVGAAAAGHPTMPAPTLSRRAGSRRSPCGAISGQVDGLQVLTEQIIQRIPSAWRCRSDALAVGGVIVSACHRIQHPGDRPRVETQGRRGLRDGALIDCGIVHSSNIVRAVSLEFSVC
jgi:hypothetical protein